MKAVVYRGPNDLRIESLDVPRIAARELLVRVAVCGVCPTDIKKIQHGTLPPPRVFGHETAGVIVKIGALVRGFRVGDRVALHHHVPCLDCHYCRHRTFAQCATYKRTGITAGFEPAGGGYAEFVRVMPFVLPGVVRIPRKNHFVEGAMLEPVNTVLKAVRRLNLLSGDAVAVVGQGPIGLMFTRLLAIEGVRVLATDLMPEKLTLARRFGARLALNGAESDLPHRIESFSRGRGLDAVVLAVPGERLVEAAPSWLRGGGQMLLFAHTQRGGQVRVDPAAICVDEVDVLGSYSADVTIQRQVARLVFGRQMDVRTLITHRFPLVATAEAIELAANPQARSLKVVVSQLDGDSMATGTEPL